MFSWTRFVAKGAASVGSLVCRGSPLAVEWSKWVSTSSSIGGAGVILSLRSSGRSVSTSILVMQSCINSAHCRRFWRTYSICAHVVVVSCAIVESGSLGTSSIFISSGTSSSCIMVSWASSPLGGELICWSWSASDSFVLLAASSYADDSCCRSWVLGFGTSSIVLCFGALGSGFEVSELGWGNSLVVYRVCRPSVSGWSNCISSKVVF